MSLATIVQLGLGPGPKVDTKIMASVVSMATKTTFAKHYHKFNGENYHQEEGGPIGLRGTCGVDR